MRTSCLLSFAVVVIASLTPAAAQAQVTFTKDVAPILQNKCQACHRPDTFAPMSLLTYEDVRPWAKAIKNAVAARKRGAAAVGELHEGLARLQRTHRGFQKPASQFEALAHHRKTGDDAAKPLRLLAKNIGALVVTSGDAILGLVSEREIVHAFSRHGDACGIPRRTMIGIDR